VIVAVVRVLMVQMAIDEVIDVIAVRDGFVAAAGAVPMALVMAAAIMAGGARRRVGAGHFQLVLFHALLGHVVQMAIVQIIRVIAMLDGSVAAVGAMLVLMVFMMRRHGCTPLVSSRLNPHAILNEIGSVLAPL
jgi:hypothetical protein